MATINNGARNNPENLPVQTRMTPFQIAALKAIASMDGINSATLLRNLVDERIQRALLGSSDDDRELLVGLLKRAGFGAELESLARNWLEDEEKNTKGKGRGRTDEFRRTFSSLLGLGPDGQEKK